MLMVVEEQHLDLELGLASNDNDLRGAYSDLRQRGKEAMEAGQLEEALRLFDESLAIAEEVGDQKLADLAVCNRAGVAITLGHYDDDIPQLRVILMRNADTNVAFHAAYNLARTYGFKKSYKKALFYAQVARDKALAWGQIDRIAGSHLETGRSLVAESRFAEAIAEFKSTLRILPEELSVVRASTLANLAYPMFILGHKREAFEMLFACLRWYRQAGKKVYEAWPHIVLCYAYNEIGRIRYAWSHGRKALALAETVGDYEAIKKSLFLLGNVEKAGGDYKAAYDYFARLRDEFYPEHANLPESMLVFEAKQLVNLRA